MRSGESDQTSFAPVPATRRIFSIRVHGRRRFGEISAGREALSYSYASPFSSAAGYKLNDTRRAGFALMADKNPGDAGPFEQAAGPSVNAPPLEMAVANSKQTIARPGRMFFTPTVMWSSRTRRTAGSGTKRNRICTTTFYTALRTKPLERGQYVPRYLNGVLGRDVGPAWDFDSYLVPTATDELELPPAPVATQPATAPVTKPVVRPASSQPANDSRHDAGARPFRQRRKWVRATTTTAPTSRPATRPTR